MFRRFCVVLLGYAAMCGVASADIGKVGNPYAPATKKAAPAKKAAEPAKAKKASTDEEPLVTILLDKRRTNMEAPLRRAISTREENASYEIVGSAPKRSAGALQEGMVDAHRIMVGQLGIDPMMITTRTEPAKGDNAEIRIFKKGGGKPKSGR